MENILTHWTTDLILRLDGPLHFRFIIQPLIATGFAFRDGLRDARKGYPAYGWALLTDRAHRQFLIRNGWKGISKVFIVAVVLDLIYQTIALHQFRLSGALIVACFLALLPYVLLRGLVNRLMRHQVNRQRRRRGM
ncbi:MAG TPA: hypothetical protein V6C65_33260 [Allocoleopsis sp.]